MEISTDRIKQLRDQTGVSVMLCRKALEEAGGDMENAKVILRRKGAESAVKKTDRVLGAGTIVAYMHHGGTVGAMVELSSETDFVSGNEAFRALAYDIAMHVAAQNPSTLDELLMGAFIKNPDVTIQSLIENAVQKFGEKIEITRFVRFSVGNR